MEILEKLLAGIGLLVIASVPFYLARALYYRQKARRLQALLDERLRELEMELTMDAGDWEQMVALWAEQETAPLEQGIPMLRQVDRN